MDEHAQILQGRGLEPRHGVEELVVKTLPDKRQLPSEHPEIDDHPGLRVRLPLHRHLGVVGMPMDTGALFSFQLASQSVSCIEEKAL